MRHQQPPQLPRDRRRVRPCGRGHHQLKGGARGGAHEAVEQRRATGGLGRGVGKWPQPD